MVYAEASLIQKFLLDNNNKKKFTFQIKLTSRIRIFYYLTAILFVDKSIVKLKLLIKILKKSAKSCFTAHATLFHLKVPIAKLL